MQCSSHQRGKEVQKTAGCKVGQMKINCLEDGTHYKFFGTPERLLQGETVALDSAAKVYLQRLSIIWSSPLSDSNRVEASNEFALPVLSYVMWSQHWCLTDLRYIDRQARTIVSENGGKHPLSSKALIYLPRTQ